MSSHISSFSVSFIKIVALYYCQAPELFNEAQYILHPFYTKGFIAKAFLVSNTLCIQIKIRRKILITLCSP